ncbi:MAG: hypothetical protein STSR0001_18310 [Methanothrix sp.]
MNNNRVGKRHKNSRLWATAFGLLVLLALSACALAQEKTAESWYKSGQELEKMGSWKEAVDAYDQAIILNPDYKEAWCAKCKALSIANLELSGEEQNITFAKAIQACDRALEIDPEDSRSWAGKGFVLFNEAIVTADPGKFNESLLAYEKAIEVAGSDTSALAEAWRGKGTALAQMGQGEEALAAQEKAIELNESDVEAWMGKAMALSELGRDEEAVQAYDRIFELYKNEEQRIFDYPYIWYSKGRVLEKLGREEEAAQAFNRSVEDVDTIIGWVASGREFYMNLSLAWQYKGQLLEEQGRYEEAVAALDNATKIEPKSIRDWNLKGFLLASELGRYEEAIKAYDQSLEIDPADSGALVGKGNVLRSLSRYQEAGELYDRAFEITPQLPQNSYQLAKAWYGKGEVLRNQGRYEEALKAYDKAIEIDPRYPQEPGIGRAMALDHMDRHEEALAAYNQSLADYERITKDNPRKSYVWHGLGRSLAGLGRYEEAIAAYEKAIELNPRYIDAWISKGIALSNLAIMEYSLKDPGNFTRTLEDSLFAFDRAIDIDPGNSVAWLEKGFALGFMEPLRYNESISAYDRAIELMPANDTVMLAFAWMERGAVLSRRADSTNDMSLYEEAIKAFDTAIELNPQQAGTLAVKANALMNLGRYNESLKILDEAIEIASRDSEKAQIWFEKAHLFAEQGNYNETAKALEKATELNPEDKNLWLNGGVLLSAVLNRNDEALGYYDRALQIDPADGYAWHAKGEALKALGRTSEADAAFEKAKELGYKVQKESSVEPSSTPKMLTIISIKATGEDEFVAVANSRAAAQSLHGWTLDVSDGRNDSRNQSLTLPDFIIDPDERINVHLGKGESNETDVFLNSVITLNDTAGNITLKDETGMSVASFEYRVEPDGSITGIMTAEGEFSYPQSNSNEVKMVVREAGSGPYVTERTEYEPESAYSWVDKGNAMAEQGNYDEAIKALDNATELDSQDKHIWMSKGLILTAHLGRYNESIEAYERAIQIDPNDADAWFGKGVALNKTGRYEEASQALNKATDLDPKLVAAWKVKGDALRALGRNSEADAAFAKAEELGYKR